METRVFDFGTLKIADRLIIGEMHEGADIQMDAAAKVKEVAEERFKDKRWGYISNRINSYSLNPMVHFQAAEDEGHNQMVALAVVTHRESQTKQVGLEKKVSSGKYKFETFSDLESAVSWITGVLENQ